MEKRTLVLFATAIFSFSSVVCAGSLDSSNDPSQGSQMYSIDAIYNRLNTGAAGTMNATFSEPATAPGGTGHTLNDVMGVAPIIHSSGSTTSNVLENTYFWGLRTEGGWGLLEGSMPNIGRQVITPGTSNQTISLGYHSGAGYVAGDLNLSADNITFGVNIFNVIGTAILATGDATPADVLSGRSFSNADGNHTGAMTNATQNIFPGTSDQTINQGYHEGTGVVYGDVDIMAVNIRSGVTIFGILGDSNVVDTSSGDAVAGDIADGRIAWVDGIQVTGVGGTISNAAPVAKTGQTTYFYEGDDGNHEDGAFWPNPRFTNHGDGTVTDNLTGLMWLQDANPNGMDSWVNQIVYCNFLEVGGYTDWKMPNINQLMSIIDWSEWNPCIPSGHPFNNIQSWHYWSSTTSANDVNYAWNIQMEFGVADDFNKTSSYHVWPVRTPQ